MDISTVIPTRNRKESLFRLLKSLSLQSYKLKEVIIIDSSDHSLSPSILNSEFPSLHIIYKTSEPSACIQRNAGIRLATSSHVFLCPDDLEVPKEYLTRVVHYFETHPEAGAVSGLLVEPDSNGELQYHFPTIKLTTLLWHFIFQLTVWADLTKTRTTLFGRPLLSLLQWYYRYKGNTYSLAGWPLVTQVNAASFRTSLFSLGGAVIRRDWLLLSPYDEILDTHGIGDNYGVTLNFPGKKPIVVIKETYIIHHKSNENRLSKPQTYFRRILALHYFLTTSNKFLAITQLFLIWSLLGNLIYQVIKHQGEMRRATSKAIRLILTGHNPYLIAFQQGNVKCISPTI